MKNKVIATLAVAMAAISPAFAADWPQWGGSGSKNMVSAERNLPDSFNPDTPGSGNLKWVAALGEIHAYGSPVVSKGKVFVGVTSNTSHDPRRNVKSGGAVLCFDENTGKLLWQLLIPKFKTDDPKFNFDHLKLGVCSTCAVDGNRVYFVSNRDELVCLDAAGLANGNDGPCKEEAAYMTSAGEKEVPLGPMDADIIWNLDMINDPSVNAWPQDAADCSVLVLGNYIYVSPSNGVDNSHTNIPRPNAPSLMIVDKGTGKVIARDRLMVGPKILHGEWSSPSTGKVGSRELVFYGTGDGVCTAFDAKPTKSVSEDGLATLNAVWRFDVNAAAGRHGKYKTKEGPSEIIATPVFYKNRVYVTIGQDPTHGKGHGALVCIDATQKGEITKSGKIWMFEDMDRSISSVTISDGLAYTCDNFGMVFCLDADTGKLYWKHDTQQPICSTPVVADGKVYVGTDRGDLWVFKHGKEFNHISTTRLGSAIAATPTPANGTLFVETQSKLFAAQLDKKAK